MLAILLDFKHMSVRPSWSWSELGCPGSQLVQFHLPAVSQLHRQRDNNILACCHHSTSTAENLLVVFLPARRRRSGGPPPPSCRAAGETPPPSVRTPGCSCSTETSHTFHHSPLDTLLNVLAEAEGLVPVVSGVGGGGVETDVVEDDPARGTGHGGAGGDTDRYTLTLLASTLHTVTYY